jgi:hypothetical protein
VVLLLAAAIIVAGVIAVAMGRGGELAPAPADFAPLDLTEVTSTDVALLRPPSALWGYHREATDEAFSQIARTISDQEVQIATLQRQLADLLPRRIPSGTGPIGMNPAGPGPSRTGPGSPGLSSTGPGGTDQFSAGPIGTGPFSAGPVSAATTGASSGGPPFPDLDPPPGIHPPPWMSEMPQAEPSPRAEPPSRTEPPPRTEPPSQPGSPPAADPPGMEPPSRPSILHRELTDQTGAPEPAPVADPWSAWERRSAEEAAPPGDDPGEDR